MTQEDKELLLKDLLGRIPYSLRFKIGDYSDYTLIGVVFSDEHPIKVKVTEKDIVYKIEVSVDNVKPYLRSMSSMTEEEENEWNGLNIDSLLEAVGKQHTRIEDLMLRAKSQYKPLDWLNAHHFDFRNLIGRGLALEAPKEMYN